MEAIHKKVKEVITKLSSVKGSNSRDLYKSHLYWSQKPYNICDILIQELTEKSNVICDPFLGSGVTLIEAMAKGLDRKAIGIEINDYPLFLVRTLLKKYSLLDVLNEFTRLKRRILDLQDLYSTTCCICGKRHTLIKSIFNYDQNHELILSKIYYKCGNQLLEKTADKEDIEQYSDIKLSDLRFLQNQKLLPNSRIAVKENETIFDIFTKRNLCALDSIFELIETSKFKDLLLYSLLGIIHLSKITDLKSSSQWPLWTPNRDCVEKNVYDLFIKSLDKTLDSLSDAEKTLAPLRREVENYNELENSSYLILKKGTQHINSKDIPDESVDLIITDPPYLGQVIYSEYMQLYQPFLKNDIDYNSEIVVSKTKQRNKTEKVYYSELGKAFNQISRILKTGKVLAVYFHDASLKFWSQFYDIVSNNNLTVVGQTHITKNKSTFKNILSPKKSLSGDALLFFIKGLKITTREVDTITLIEEIKAKAKDIINSHSGKATTSQLYDEGILEHILKSGKIHDLAEKYSDLTDIFSEFLIWNQSGYWTLN